jgi:glycosyltransferase involved in cell wall biosynthesis
MNVMAKLGFPVESIIDFGEGDIPRERRWAMALESDITLAYQITSQFRFEMMKQAPSLKPMRDDSGEMQWPATFISDTDDDLFNVQPLNMTFGMLGVADPATGKELEDGAEVGIAHPLEIAEGAVQKELNKQFPLPLPGARGDLKGQRFIFAADGKWHNYFSLWKDGKNMDLKHNRGVVNMWRKIMKASQLVTCSTPRVEQMVKRECGADTPTFVTPNAIDFGAYPFVELQDHPGEVRILWQGSATHHEDLWPLNESIARVAKKHPETTWIFWGAPYKWAEANIPADRVKVLPWVHHEAYITRLSTINHDINLAPLTPHIFNQSRSAIKWYESSCICKPAATLAQNTGAYHDEIQDGETGLIFSTPGEFETKLSGLIEDAKLRQALASNARDWCKTNRDARKIMTTLFHKYAEVREGHKQSMPIDEAPAVMPAAAPAGTHNFSLAGIE